MQALGIDDMFVIMQCWENVGRDATNKELPASEKVGLSLRHAGVSITVTSLTDIFAFGAGALSDLIHYGASPRATIFLAKAARAHAFLRHRGYVIPEDVKATGLDVLRHRVIPTYEAEAEDLTSEDLVRRLFELVEVP